MKGLRLKLLTILAAGLLAAGGVAFSAYLGSKVRFAQREAVRQAEAAADVFGAALSPLLERLDRGALRASVSAAGKGSLARAIAVVGRSGRVLASSPPLPEVPDLVETPVCAGCHRGGYPRPRSLRVLRAGADVVRVCRPLAGGAACSRCHDPARGAPGRVVMEVPLSGLAGLRGEALAIAGVAGAALILLAAIFHRALTSLVFRPLDHLRQVAAGVGSCKAGESGGGSRRRRGDFEDLTCAIEAAGLQQAEIVKEISTLAFHLRERGAQVGGALAQLREGVQLGRDAAEAILHSAGQLDGSMEQTRSKLNNIASSTSDNSTSLIEMSASVDEVAESADQLAQHVATTASSVLQMVTSIGEVVERVEVLARETDLTASSMAQIDGSTRQIEDNARQAAALSGRMAETAREGSLAVQETLQGIHASHEVMQNTARAMGELKVASEAIDGVVKIINDINDKTKLLALNAAIIAAQAGEHGKSFAVVAHEIKNLSDRTVTSTAEISKIVRGIRERMEVATQAVSRGRAATGQSVDLAERAGHTLGRILSTAQVSHDMTREILRGTEEQSRGSQRVMASMQEVSAMVTYIRQAAGEHRESGERVSASTEVMRDLTEQVKFATAEQAEVSRYISEAIATIDQNLRDLLRVVDQEREEREKILEHTGRLKERSEGQQAGIRDVEAVIQELQAQIGGLKARTAELTAPGDAPA